MNAISSTDPMPAGPEMRPSSAGPIARDGQSSVRLLPDMPPGRCTRKALPFADEIHRLYATGYTLEAIRQALSAAGVTVSRSTVHREVARARKQPSGTPSTNAPRCELNLASQMAADVATSKPKQREAATSPGPPPSPEEPGQTSFAYGPRGEDVAKAFMATQVTNTFMRQKEQK